MFDSVYEIEIHPQIENDCDDKIRVALDDVHREGLANPPWEALPEY